MSSQSPIRALALLIPGSALVAATGIASAKAWAILLGVGGYGQMGLLQNAITLLVIVAELGMAAAVVKIGAPHIAGGSPHLAAQVWVGAARITWPIMMATALGTALLAPPLARLILGTEAARQHIWWCIPAVLLTVGVNVRTGILNAHHRVAPLAKLQVVAAFFAAIVSIALIGTWGTSVLGMALAGAALARWMVATWFLRKETGVFALLPWRNNASQDTKVMLRFGISFTLSTFASAGVQALIPLLIRPTLGAIAVGYYQAAYYISVGSLGFLLTAMAQDYYPRISGGPRDRDTTFDLLNRQHRLVMLVGVPVILTLKALAPFTVILLTSREFLPSVAILEWQLTGDLLKFSSWTFSFMVLARTSGRTFFATELAAGIALLVGIVGGSHLLGLVGLGIGFFAAYVVYWIVTRFVVAKYVLGGRVLSRNNDLALLASISLALLPELFVQAGLANLKQVVSIVVAFAACLFCGQKLLKEYANRNAPQA